MKNYITTILLCTLFLHSAYAKKVKFSVDMSGHVISAYGIHVSGDFQTAAGYPGGDWTANTNMTQELSDTNIYSVIVDIPAFTKYEYKFMNGDQFYEAEFVPIESRVGYNFNDNRWIYIDSLSNDTTFIGAIRFGGNAPKGKKLVRLYVDMQNESVSPNRVHLYGDFQNQNPYSVCLYNLDAAVHEVIVFTDSLSSYEYKFYNGNQLADAETVPGTCAVNGNRSYTATKDSMMGIICFSSCSACMPSSTTDYTVNTTELHLYPNPAKDYSVLTFKNAESAVQSVSIYDISGKQVRNIHVNGAQTLQLNKEHLQSGIYLIRTMNKNGTRSLTKWIIE